MPDVGKMAEMNAGYDDKRFIVPAKKNLAALPDGQPVITVKVQEAEIVVRNSDGSSTRTLESPFGRRRSVTAAPNGEILNVDYGDPD